ncbi:MAG TPA: DUF885 domain-containing protein [Steroidobacteraceae bacterium]|nr:DUF885 domain-containing protein [Steroidobacteraceae bacterium]
MLRHPASIFAACMLAAPAAALAAAQWIEDSNHYSQMLVEVRLNHSPEYGSSQGLSQYDTKISHPTLADELAARAERDAVIEKIKAQLPLEKDRNVAEDMRILIHAVDLQDRELALDMRLDVPFINASEQVFRGLKVLLDDQVAPERRACAVIRLQRYAGVEAGFVPVTEIYEQRIQEQMAKPGMTYPSRSELETELGRDSNYVQGIAALFKKYQLSGWQDAYAKLEGQLADYDAWIRAQVLPKARTDFRLPPEEYALSFERYGIDISPAQISAEAHAAFKRYQQEMAPIAARIAKQRKLPSSDYRAVIAELKKAQITGDAILPFYEQRLKDIEAIIVEHDIVSLPERPAIIRLATPAETVQQPAPHMKPPPLLHNTGQRGEFILPLNIPSASGGAEDKYDDFTFDAVAWTLTAHEARPGHELQFDSMVEHGTSIARAQYAFNSTNAEGWGLYSEYLIEPYMPPEGQLMSLDLRLLRAARAFLDPELQAGKIQPADAYRVLQTDVVLSHAFATEEVERFTYRAPGQANSYFYGYTRLLELREETEKALGKKFDQKRFHDFILAQGLLPPDLMREAVMQNFVPAQMGRAG